MTIARRHELARLKKLAEPINERHKELDRELAELVHGLALDHACNLSLLIRFGNPQPDTPLLDAWQRCVACDDPALGPGFKTLVKDESCNPFERGRGPAAIAEYFQKTGMPNLAGTGNEEEFVDESPLGKLTPIFASAPPWLIWYTWADMTAEALGLPICDLSDVRAHERPDGVLCWPTLPKDRFADLPVSNSPFTSTPSELLTHYIQLLRMVGGGLGDLDDVLAGRRHSHR
jgi:hypothetical protein